jgi:hypothetical protein
VSALSIQGLDELYELAREKVALKNGSGKDAIRGIHFERAVEEEFENMKEALEGAALLREDD